MSRPPRAGGAKGSKTNVPGPSKGKKAAPPSDPPQAGGVPAFSVPLKKDAVAKQKKKTIVRNKAPGEDLPKMKEIVKSIRGAKISVQEFVGLISPSTGDNGDCLRLTLSDELNQFRTSSRKIYETMTQDISDVLTNEHIQLTENSKERHQLLTDKMMRCIHEIFAYCSDFDFHKYYTQAGYLEEKFPLVEKLILDEDAIAMQQRQEAYHRYQWLKSEGERMREENARLLARLNHLKKQQRNHLKEVALREQQAEIQRQQLEETQEQLEDKLDDLNDTMEKSLVEAEVAAATSQVVTLSRKPSTKPKLPKVKKHPSDKWAETAAAEMEANAIAADVKRETSKASIRAKVSRSKPRIQVKKSKQQVAPKETSPFHYSPPRSPQQAPPQERSPFHYSPPRSPPQAQARQQSPFHYSPPRSPPPQAPARQQSPFHYSPPRSPPQAQARQQSPFHYSPPRAPPQEAEITRVETTTVVTEPRQGRRGAAPRDTWGGFQ